MKETIVISGFPGVGKSILVAKASELGLVISDSDSSQFDKSEFPQNYIQHLNELAGKVDVVLVSSHKEVREAMDEDGINYVMVYPDPSRKQEFLGLYNGRGNTEAFVNLLDENWDNWLEDIETEQPGLRIKLGPEKFLSDIISPEVIEMLGSAIFAY